MSVRDLKFIRSMLEEALERRSELENLLDENAKEIEAYRFVLQKVGEVRMDAAEANQPRQQLVIPGAGRAHRQQSTAGIVYTKPPAMYRQADVIAAVREMMDTGLTKFTVSDIAKHLEVSRNIHIHGRALGGIGRAIKTAFEDEIEVTGQGEYTVRGNDNAAAAKDHEDHEYSEDIVDNQEQNDL